MTTSFVTTDQPFEIEKIGARWVVLCGADVIVQTRTKREAMRWIGKAEQSRADYRDRLSAERCAAFVIPVPAEPADTETQLPLF